MSKYHRYSESERKGRRRLTQVAFLTDNGKECRTFGLQKKRKALSGPTVRQAALQGYLPKAKALGHTTHCLCALRRPASHRECQQELSKNFNTLLTPRLFTLEILLQVKMF